MDLDFKERSLWILDEMRALGLRPAEAIAIDEILGATFYHPHERLSHKLFSLVKNGTANFTRMQLDALQEMLADLRLIKDRFGNMPLSFSDARFYVHKLRTMRSQRIDQSDRPAPEDWALLSRITSGEPLERIAEECDLPVGAFTVRMRLLADKFDCELMRLERIRREAEHELASRNLNNQGLDMGASSHR